MFSKLNSSMANSVVQRSMLSTIIRGLILARSFKKFLISLFFGVYLILQSVANWQRNARKISPYVKKKKKKLD